MFQTYDRSHITGMIVSLGLHGAVAAALAYQVASSGGLLTPAREPRAITMVLLPAEHAETRAPAQRAAGVRSVILASAAPMEGASSHARAAAPTSANRSGASSADLAGFASATMGAGRTAQDGLAQTNYQSILRDHLNRFFVYPEAARADGLAGHVELHIVVARGGEVMSTWIQRSSGRTVLDEAALDLVHRAQPFPPLPTDLPDTIEIALPLDYAAPEILLGGR